MLENSNSQEFSLPDNKDCRAKKVEAFDLIECISNQKFCPFAFHFGYDLLLCRHPRRNEIVERTTSRLDYFGSQKP